MPYYKFIVGISRLAKAEKNQTKVELSNDRYAQNAMLAGAFVTLAALVIVPLYWSGRPSWWLTYNSNTGVIGDTIGGIAGPILNFAGLIVVYYSLREQIVANKAQAQQLQHEVERSRNDQEFELTLQLVEKLIDEAKHGAEAFKEIGLKDWETNWDGMLGATTTQADKNADLFDKYMRRVKNLADSFLMIVKRIESVRLSFDQQSVLQRILTMQYEPFLLECKSGYETYFNNTQGEPDMLRLARQQLHVLEKQRNRIDNEMKLVNNTTKAS